MSTREDALEAPAHLGEPRFEEVRAVSERSVGSVGLLAVLALIGAAGSFLTRDWGMAWVAMAIFAIACPGFILLVRRLVDQQRAEERSRRPRVLG